MSREQALSRLEKPADDPETIAHEFEYIATKLGITVDELEGYLNAPNKSYREYRSQIRLYDIGYRVVRVLGIELGGKR